MVESTHQNISFIPLIISTIVLCIMLFSIYVTIRYRNPDQYKQTRLNVFFSTLASVAIIFVGMNIFMTSLSYESNQHFSRLTKTKEALDKLWVYPNRLLLDFHNLRPEFRAGFYMSNVDLYNMIIKPQKKSPLTEQGILEEQFVMTIMLQAWEDMISFRRYDLTPLEEWVVTFLTWAQNPFLREYWDNVKNLKFGYRTTTHELANLLFEYAAQIPIPTTSFKYYQDAMDKMVKDPRYIKLKKEIESMS